MCTCVFVCNDDDELFGIYESLNECYFNFVLFLSAFV